MNYLQILKQRFDLDNKYADTANMMGECSLSHVGHGGHACHYKLQIVIVQAVLLQRTHRFKK